MLWWVFEKILIPVFNRLLSGYVERTFTARRWYKKSESDLAPNQKQALAVLSSIRFRPVNPKGVSEQAMDEMVRSLDQLFAQNTAFANRKFGFNFMTDYTQDMTIGEMMDVLRHIDPPILASILGAVTRELRDDPAVRLISVRDVFVDLLGSTEDRCRMAFEEAGYLQHYLGKDEDVKAYASLRPASDQLDYQLKYGGVDVPIDTGQAFHKSMRLAQKDMKRIGRQTSRLRCSQYHIVMSVALGDRWGDAAQPNGRFMVITAGKTNKGSLLIPSQTPVVAHNEGEWVFYGDQAALPSSELLTHWTIHESIAQSASAFAHDRAIFHAHLVDITNESDNHLQRSSIEIGDMRIPNIDWVLRGTPELGQKIAEGMVSLDSAVAIVKHHGPWFVCSNLTKGYEQAITLIEKIGERT